MSGAAPGGGAGAPAEARGVAAVVLGRVLGAFGVHGWVRIRPFTESPDGLLSQAMWVLIQSGAKRTVEVEEAKPHGAFVLARLKGVVDRGDAESLRGADVTVFRDQLPEPGVGEYYWSDLIGLRVRNEQGVELGTVTGLIAAPAHDVLRVAASAVAETETESESGGESDAGRERLIPFVEPILRAVDAAGGWITVDWEADY